VPDAWKLRLSSSGTYLTDYHVAQTPAAPMLDLRNFIFRPLTFRARASVTWDHGPFSMRVLASHVGGYTNNVTAVTQEVSSYTPIDLALTWRLNGGGDESTQRDALSVSLEVRDLFDTGPPYVNIAPSVNGSGGYDASAASPIGRVFAVTARVSM